MTIGTYWAIKFIWLFSLGILPDVGHPYWLHLQMYLWSNCITYYGNAIGPDGLSNAQPVGSVTAIWKGGLFMLQNDLFALSNRGDKWRTNAWELTLGDFSIGSYIYTNDGKKASGGLEGKDDNLTSPIWGANRNAPKFTSWKDGRVYSAPIWVGVRSGNSISRFGYSFRGSQDLQQNGIHSRTGFGNQNYYLNYQDFYSGIYLNSGYYNSFSLWGH
ncbi:MAG: hypothetical protein LBJ17_03990 [Dysgonamonadaceae bacterium]|nr:hypothetical protein [Dysgonamonadaceae bacterium]